MSTKTVSNVGQMFYGLGLFFLVRGQCRKHGRHIKNSSLSLCLRALDEKTKKVFRDFD